MARAVLVAPRWRPGRRSLAMLAQPPAQVCSLCSHPLALARDQRVGPPGTVHLVCEVCQPMFPELAEIPVEVDPLPRGPVDG